MKVYSIGKNKEKIISSEIFTQTIEHYAIYNICDRVCPLFISWPQWLSRMPIQLVIRRSRVQSPLGLATFFRED